MKKAIVLLLGLAFSAAGAAIPGDLDRDGEVDLVDLFRLAESIGRPDPAADLDGDGSVAMSDFGILRDHFGLTTPDVESMVAASMLVDGESRLCFATPLSSSIVLTDYSGWVAGVAWSRDLAQAAFIQGGRDSLLVVVDTQTGATEEIPLGMRASPPLSWDPTGSHVALSLLEGEQWHVYVFELGSRELARLTTREGNELQPEWTEIGILASTDWSGDQDVYLLDEKGDVLQQLTSHPADDEHPKLSPDGRWLAFASDRINEEPSGGHFGYFRDGQSVFVDGLNELYVRDLRGPTGEKALGPPRVWGPEVDVPYGWTADSAWIRLSRGGVEGWCCNAAGSPVVSRGFVSPMGVLRFFEPGLLGKISPNGNLGFGSSEHGEFERGFVNRHTGRLVSQPLDLRLVDWSPARSHLQSEETERAAED